MAIGFWCKCCLSPCYDQFKDWKGGVWASLLLAFLHGISYGLFAPTLVLWFSETFAQPDFEASFAYGVIGVVAAAAWMASGFVIDVFPAFRACAIGAAIVAYTQTALGLLPLLNLDKTIGFLIGVALLVTLDPIGNALFDQALRVAIKRISTNEEDRRVIYHFVYAAANAGVVVGSIILDLMRRYITPISLADASVMWTTSGTLFLCFGVAMFCVKIADWHDDPNVQQTPKSPVEIVGNLVQNRSFRQYLVLMLVFINISTLFRHLSITLPKFMIREFSPNSPFALYASINPALIIVLSPILGFCLRNTPEIHCFVIGGIIASISPLWAAFAHEEWGVALFITTLSVAEAIYVPRLTEYAMKLSPQGSEGAFVAMAAVPTFLNRLPAGLLSGWLLDTYCPAPGDCRALGVWLWIAGLALLSTVVLTILVFVDFFQLPKKRLPPKFIKYIPINLEL